MGNDYDTMRLQAARLPLEGSVPPPTSAKTALADHLRDQKLFDNASGEALRPAIQSGTAAFEDMYPRSETIADARWPDIQVHSG